MSFDLHLGDKVTIRTWDNIVKTFGVNPNGSINTFPACFSQAQIKPYCGHSYIVEDITYDSQTSWCKLQGVNYDFPFCFLDNCPASYMPPVVNAASKDTRPIFSWFDVLSKYGSNIGYLVHGDIFTPGAPLIAEKIYSNVALQVGDIVTLRDWDDMKKEFHVHSDTIDFPGTQILMTPKKRQFCNGTYKIKNIPWVPLHEPPLYEFEDVPDCSFPIQCIASCLTSFDDRR